MKFRKELLPTITESQFDNGYWYATEIKSFAKRIGIAHAAQLRKGELEKLIKLFLWTGEIRQSVKGYKSTKIKDIEKGLDLNLPIVNYVSNSATRDFIVREAKKIEPMLKYKLGHDIE